MTVTDTVRAFPSAPSRPAPASAGELDARAREVYARVDGGDIGGLLELFSDDVVYERPGYQPIVGRTSFERFYREARVIREGVHTPDSVVVGEDGRVAVQGSFAGVLKDGTSVSLRYADFFTSGPDGRFRRRDTYFFSPMV
ncbi:nuclear transport factor 2 family protein [Nocardiopsis algeriensis]|uniref:SnoaL-like domain-containing protein n=1 Tax=Nocardiopsis algeriensis TaxID=1478215 RepID=A0A841IP03_9ACTN|nr:nuclear transport factor 2 family protein [Nocardiopsis algeriensis]MBB6118425.1 hypothetical protein [Nocardiopsis algeriensis]